jgi:hypothetical protein
MKEIFADILPLLDEIRGLLSFTRHFCLHSGLFPPNIHKKNLDERTKNDFNNPLTKGITEGQIEIGQYRDEKKDNRYKRHSSNYYHVDSNIYGKHDNIYLYWF